MADVHTIRAATTDDAPAIASIGRALHAESPEWSRFGYDEAKVASTFRTLMAMPNFFVRVAESESQIVGGIAALATTHWSSDDLVAQEMTFFLLPEHRGAGTAARLIRAMTNWSRDIGCVRLQAGTSTGITPERTTRLYEAMGFRRSVVLLERWNGR